MAHMLDSMSPFVHDIEKSKKRQIPNQSEPSQKDPTNYKQKVIRFSAIKLEESVISRQATGHSSTYQENPQNTHQAKAFFTYKSKAAVTISNLS